MYLIYRPMYLPIYILGDTNRGVAKLYMHRCRGTDPSRLVGFYLDEIVSASSYSFFLLARFIPPRV